MDEGSGPEYGIRLDPGCASLKPFVASLGQRLEGWFWVCSSGPGPEWNGSGTGTNVTFLQSEETDAKE
jgi:hypothetical protein